MKKKQLLFCVQIVVLGAVAPVCAMPDFDGWEWNSDKQYTDEEWQGMFQPKNVRAIYSSFPSKTVENFKKELGLQDQAPTTSSASSSHDSHVAPASEKVGESADAPQEDNAQRKSDVQKEDADKYQAMVDAAGLREIDPALRFRARFSLQNPNPSDSDSNSDTDPDADSEDSDVQETALQAAQLDTPKIFFPAQKNKNCCSRLRACLNRMFAAGLPAKKRSPSPAPTLGSLLNKL